MSAEDTPKNKRDNGQSPQPVDGNVKSLSDSSEVFALGNENIDADRVIAQEVISRISEAIMKFEQRFPDCQLNYKVIEMSNADLLRRDLLFAQMALPTIEKIGAGELAPYDLHTTRECFERIMGLIEKHRFSLRLQLFGKEQLQKTDPSEIIEQALEQYGRNPDPSLPEPDTIRMYRTAQQTYRISLRDVVYGMMTHSCRSGLTLSTDDVETARQHYEELDAFYACCELAEKHAIERNKQVENLSTTNQSSDTNM